MKTTKIKMEKTAERFSVIVNKKEIFKTSEQIEAVEKINEQFKSQTELIILIDGQNEISTHYSKSLNQRNYRIFQGDFSRDIEYLETEKSAVLEDQNISIDND